MPKDPIAKRFIPPIAAQRNARKALSWKNDPTKEVDAMTKKGWDRAKQLAQGKPLTREDLKSMAQFNRHRKNAKIEPEHKGTPWRDNGRVAWLGWGGDAGISWAKNTLKRLRKK